ncbi:hypothetical protein HMI54_010011 [Coelomomyces lativittatus]|nr:hypothetical protein HMI55_002136 [Coelomomyces lativittatus]KAJ1512481.1 hypothetical protein HMI56_004008 [Coelomomyces lativittatus]KAJ1516299.1 hypothetical protein HMI54_010011 [Coelomomyces lativittatus]
MRAVPLLLSNTLPKKVHALPKPYVSVPPSFPSLVPPHLNKNLLKDKQNSFPHSIPHPISKKKKLKKMGNKKTPQLRETIKRIRFKNSTLQAIMDSSSSSSSLSHLHSVDQDSTTPFTPRNSETTFIHMTSTQSTETMDITFPHGIRMTTEPLNPSLLSSYSTEHSPLLLPAHVKNPIELNLNDDPKPSHSPSPSHSPLFLPTHITATSKDTASLKESPPPSSFHFSSFSSISSPLPFSSPCITSRRRSSTSLTSSVHTPPPTTTYFSTTFPSPPNLPPLIYPMPTTPTINDLYFHRLTQHMNFISRSVHALTSSFLQKGPVHGKGWVNPFPPSSLDPVHPSTPGPYTSSPGSTSFNTDDAVSVLMQLGKGG